MDLISSVGTSLLAFVFVLGVMIFVHELGHYAVAKFLGIRVEVFSLGFGPRILGFTRGDTDYRVSLLPLGGYVKMAGETYDEDLTGSEEEFLSRPKLHRFAVAVAGPVMNIFLAWFLLAVSYTAGVEVAAYRGQPAVIGVIVPDSPAERAGLQLNDRIVSIDGEPTPAWAQVELTIGISPNQTLRLGLEREDGSRVDKEVTTKTQGTSELGTIGAGPSFPWSIEGVDPVSPAAEADLREGDAILYVDDSDGKRANGFYEIPPFVESRAGQPLLFTILRQEQILEKTIIPVKMGDMVRIGIKGKELVKLDIERYGPVEAVVKSFRRNVQITGLTFYIVGKIVTGRASLKTMSGPIEIARYSGAAASSGLIHLMGFMALVSLQLGIFNLFPIPILDGGVIALLAVEGLIGRDLSLAVKERIFQVGFIFLVLLMGVVIFNDVSKNLPFFD